MNEATLTREKAEKVTRIKIRKSFFYIIEKIFEGVFRDDRFGRKNFDRCRFYSKR